LGQAELHGLWLGIDKQVRDTSLTETCDLLYGFTNQISCTTTGIGTAIGAQHQQRLRWLLPPLYRLWIAYDQEIDL
jgi:hypothetical protein